MSLGVLSPGLRLPSSCLPLGRTGVGSPLDVLSPRCRTSCFRGESVRPLLCLTPFPLRPLRTCPSGTSSSELVLGDAC